MFRLIALLLSLQTVFAQYAITADKSSYSASDTMVVSWSTVEDSVLNLKDLDTARVLLCTCGSSGKFKCNAMVDNAKISDKKESIPMSKIVDMGPDGDYMLQLAAINSKNKGEYALSYSTSWFTLSGMTGTGKAEKGTCQVPSNSDENVPGTGSASLVSWTSYTLPQSLASVSGFDIPYTWQKGPTRTAPFQSTPGTKVTQSKTPSRRFPQSSMTPFKTYFMNKYMPVQTATPGPSSSAIQQENFVKSLATTPSGRRPSRIMPTLSLPTLSSKSGSNDGKNGRKRRWAD